MKSYMNCPLFYSKNKWFNYVCLQNVLGTSSSDFESQSTLFPTSMKRPETLYLTLDVDLNYEKSLYNYLNETLCLYIEPFI